MKWLPWNLWVARTIGHRQPQSGSWMWMSWTKTKMWSETPIVSLFPLLRWLIPATILNRRWYTNGLSCWPLFYFGSRELLIRVFWPKLWRQVWSSRCAPFSAYIYCMWFSHDAQQRRKILRIPRCGPQSPTLMTHQCLWQLCVLGPSAFFGPLSYREWTSFSTSDIPRLSLVV